MGNCTRKPSKPPIRLTMKDILEIKRQQITILKKKNKKNRKKNYRKPYHSDEDRQAVRWKII